MISLFTKKVESSCASLVAKDPSADVQRLLSQARWGSYISYAIAFLGLAFLLWGILKKERFFSVPVLLVALYLLLQFLWV